LNKLNYFAVFALAAIPALFYGLVYYREKEDLDMASTKTLIGSLYVTLNTDSMYQLMQPIMFCLKRLMFVMALRDVSFPMQWGGMIWAILFQMIYYLNAKPFNDRLLKVTELTNEFIMLLLIYMLPTFTSFIPNDVYKMANYRFGWIFLAIVCPLFLFNFSVTIVAVVSICLEKRRQSRRLAYDKEQV
jgi:hypothetical protein